MKRTIFHELEDEIGVPAETYLLDSWYKTADLVETIGSRGKNWIVPVRSNRPVEFGHEKLRVDNIQE